MVTLECVYSLGITQSPPLVPLVSVGFGQHLQLVCDVLVEVTGFRLGGLGTHPLPGHHVLSSWTRSTRSRAGASRFLFRGLAIDEGLQVILRNLVIISGNFLLLFLSQLAAKQDGNKA